MRDAKGESWNMHVQPAEWQIIYRSFFADSNTLLGMHFVFWQQRRPLRFLLGLSSHSGRQFCLLPFRPIQCARIQRGGRYRRACPSLPFDGWHGRSLGNPLTLHSSTWACAARIMPIEYCTCPLSIAHPVH